MKKVDAYDKTFCYESASCFGHHKGLAFYFTKHFKTLATPDNRKWSHHS